MTHKVDGDKIINIWPPVSLLTMSHEVLLSLGWRCRVPNLDEIPKYGSTFAVELLAVKADLERRNDKKNPIIYASLRELASILYKERKTGYQN